MSKTTLEIFKFSVYLIIPAATVYFINTPGSMRKVIETKQYISFPPEGPRPPTGTAADMAAALEKMKQESGAARSASEVAAASVDSPSVAPKQSWSAWLFGSSGSK